MVQPLSAQDFGVRGMVKAQRAATQQRQTQCKRWRGGPADRADSQHSGLLQMPSTTGKSRENVTTSAESSGCQPSNGLTVASRWQQHWGRGEAGVDGSLSEAFSFVAKQQDEHFGLAADEALTGGCGVIQHQPGGNTSNTIDAGTRLRIAGSSRRRKQLVPSPFYARPTIGANAKSLKTFAARGRVRKTSLHYQFG